MARCFSGRLLRDAREAAGLSCEQVAVAIRRTSFSIRGYELGRVTPTVPVLANLADVYGCAVDTFFQEVADDAA